MPKKRSNIDICKYETYLTLDKAMKIIHEYPDNIHIYALYIHILDAKQSYYPHLNTVRCQMKLSTYIRSPNEANLNYKCILEALQSLRQIWNKL